MGVSVKNLVDLIVVKLILGLFIQGKLEDRLRLIHTKHELFLCLQARTLAQRRQIFRLFVLSATILRHIHSLHIIILCS